MRSSFFEYNVAVSGLFTSRSGLETVSHNVSNASTRGYSRQMALTRATTPLALYNGKGMIGTGSEVYGVTQLRNVYLDKKYWSKMGTLGEYSVKRTQLTINQTILSEMDGTTGTGLTTQFNTFFDTIQDLIENAGDITYRTNVLQNADSLTTYLNDIYSSFSKQQRDVNEEIRAVVTTINSLGVQIRALNEKIRVMEVDGSNANDLRDQRAVLVDELSRYINVEAKEVEVKPGDKQFMVQVNGQDFVNNLDFRGLECRERTATDAGGDVISLYRNPEDIGGLYDIYWAGSDYMFNLYHPNLSGELKGLIDVRDGNNGNNAKSDPLAAGSYNGATGELTMNFDYSSTRIDIAEAGGVIKITDAAGNTREFAYGSCVVTYNTAAKTAKVVFTLTQESKTQADKQIAAGKDPFAAGNKAAVGVTNDYKGIPYYLGRLNTLVRTFASAVNFGTKLNGDPIDGLNGGHVAGYNLDGQQLQTLFFTYMDGLNEVDSVANFDINKITAKNFQVYSELLSKPRLMNCSDAGSDDVDNNNVLHALLKINTDNTLFSEGKLLDYIIGMTGELGIDIKQAQNFEINYNSVTTLIDNQRMSVSGVDINEEMIDMLRYNQQYQACARLMNIIDGIYDTLVNRLGLM